MFLVILMWTLARQFLRAAAQVTEGAWMLFPPTRSRSDATGTGCKAPECPGPCDGQYNPSSASQLPIARGELLQVTWPRNSHPGGFIRLSLVPASSSGNTTAFDDAASLIVCAESECYPPDPINTTLIKPDDETLCRTTFTVPQNVQNGPATLQWLYWAGGPAMAQFYSCADLLVTGGSVPVITSPALTFRGGDLTYPNLAQCRYYNSNALGSCVFQPCNNTDGFVGNGTEYAGGPALSRAVTTYAVTSNPGTTPSSRTTSVPFETFLMSLASKASVASSTIGTTTTQRPSSTTTMIQTPVPKIGGQIAVDPGLFISGLVIPLAIAAACAACPCLLFGVRDRKRRELTAARQIKRRRQSKSQAAQQPKLPPMKRSTSYVGSTRGSKTSYREASVDGGLGHPKIARTIMLTDDGGNGSEQATPLTVAGNPRRPPSHELPEPKLVEAMYAFSGVNPDEMQFSAGDRIVLHEFYSDGWGRGMLISPDGNPVSGELMALPLNYVRLVGNS